MTENLEFYKDQMAQMRTQRDAHEAIVSGLKAELEDIKSRRYKHIAEKKPVVKRTRK